MIRIRHTPLGTVVVVLAACVVAVVAVGIQHSLDHRADVARQAQLRAAEVGSALIAAQAVPFSATQPGGSALASARELRTLHGRVDRLLAQLEREAPTAELRHAHALIQANFASLKQTQGLLAAGGPLPPGGPGTPPAQASGSASRPSLAMQQRAARPLAVATRQRLAAMDALHSATVVYRSRAAGAVRTVTWGSALLIAALLAAFAAAYARSAKARMTAQQLAQDRARLAQTDALTGLGNRRALTADLAAMMDVDGGRGWGLAIYDLDGFKRYNDSFGHPAGDALLVRLSHRLARAVKGRGRAYRMGGDEFCVLAHTDQGDAIIQQAIAALTEYGESFEIECSYGEVRLNTEAQTADEALSLADQRMYARKASGRVPASRQITDVLRRVLGERGADLEEHVGDVARLAAATSQALGLPSAEVERIQLAAELHDVGKTAIPRAILNKPTALSHDEWQFMRQHTIIGERILRAAPSLANAAPLVRTSHERIDGKGYPDGLRGSAIPLGARVIAVCDAYHAMITDRPYRTAMSSEAAIDELRRGAGTRFDEQAVQALQTALTVQSSAAIASMSTI